jgi:hypothetical protein
MNAKPYLSGLALLLWTTLAANATTIWTGPSFHFTDIAGSDPTLPADQDRITPDVWIARATTEGIYNAFNEPSFTHFQSPRNTAWADGTLANYSTLSYTDWNTWVKGVHAGPPTTVGVDAVMHIIPDDIYLSVKFTSWGGSSGGFSYTRSTAPVPEPAPMTLLLLGSLACCFRTGRSLFGRRA